MATPPEEKESTMISLVVNKEMEQFSPIHRFRGYSWRVRLYEKDDNRQLEVICDKSKPAELWQCNAEITLITPFWQSSIHEFNSKDKRNNFIASSNDDYPMYWGTLLEVKITVTDDGESCSDSPILDPRQKIFEFNSWRKSKDCIVSYNAPSNMISKRWFKPLELKNTVNEDGKRWIHRPSLDLSEPYDGIIVVGEEKKEIKVHREFLASQSQFFMARFFENYKVQEVTKIAIGDVEFDTFSKMLDIVYDRESRRSSVTDVNVFTMLELAKRLQLKIVEDRIVSFLLSFSSSFSIHKKLLISEQSDLPFLTENLLKQYTKAQVIDLINSAEFDRLSFESLRVLFNTGCIDAFEPKRGMSASNSNNVMSESNTISMIVEKWDRSQLEQYSPVHRINGFPWRLRLAQGSRYAVHAYVICDKSDEAELWKCTARISIIVADLTRTTTFTFTSWDESSHEQRIFSATINKFEMEVTIESNDDGESYFRRPTIDPLESRDGILVFEGDTKKIEVNKQSLASQSPYFDRLFFGSYREKDMKEIPIGDVKYKEFSNIMAILYGSEKAHFHCKNAQRMLHLANRFDLKIIEDRVVSLLLSPYSSVVSLPKKLFISDEYYLPFLMDALLSQFKSVDQLKELAESPEWSQLSKETLRIVFKKFCI